MKMFKIVLVSEQHCISAINTIYNVHLFCPTVQIREPNFLNLVKVLDRFSAKYMVIYPYCSVDASPYE